jgi:hypothetical protein
MTHMAIFSNAVSQNAGSSNGYPVGLVYLLENLQENPIFHDKNTGFL